MGLSSILDIAIGLIFIYLILSVIASEIQELIATVLQWRAVHLKESIEGLLSGNDKESENFSKVRELSNQIYANQLIKGMNHEAKGLLARFPRRLIQMFGFVFRLLRKWFRKSANLLPNVNISKEAIAKEVDGVFGKGNSSGPSYVTKQAFTSSFIETLQVPILTKLIARLRLEDFLSRLEENLKDKLNRVREGEGAYLPDWYKEAKGSVYQDLDSHRIGISEALDRLAEAAKVETRFELFEDPFRLQNPEENCYGLSREYKKILLRQINPTLLDVIQIILIFQDPNLEKVLARIKNRKFDDVKRIVKDERFLAQYSTKDPYMIEYVSQGLLLYTTFSNTEIGHKLIKLLGKLPKLPTYLQGSLYDLAKRSQESVEDIEQQFSQFQEDIETWFDNSMVRASGVYKRNAKLVALLLGFTIAVGANADTFHIVDRLSKDRILRETIAQSAETIAMNNRPNQAQKNPQKLDKETIEQINLAADAITLPIGWENSVTSLQQKKSIRWLFGIEVAAPVITFCGWLVSAIAISMGASFWFDLLGKFIDIKNVGKRPSSTPDNN
ncbi:hypothetical protein V2H45_04395 [Tumidithrix elongata RA019]|uniref:Uncharacterized protein n=1 Tax=Tumidithrix elongata BACA0141 TaxID=2716417 RepID=A0AAW9PW12_9CYAN|nr:hypothetical protein [Tumidithrix elongata RA019]